MHDTHVCHKAIQLLELRTLLSFSDRPVPWQDQTASLLGSERRRQAVKLEMGHWRHVPCLHAWLVLNCRIQTVRSTDPYQWPATVRIASESSAQVTCVSTISLKPPPFTYVRSRASSISTATPLPPPAMQAVCHVLLRQLDRPSIEYFTRLARKSVAEDRYSVTDMRAACDGWTDRRSDRLPSAQYTDSRQNAGKWDGVYRLPNSRRITRQL
jgi:hypothetical protein